MNKIKQWLANNYITICVSCVFVIIIDVILAIIL